MDYYSNLITEKSFKALQDFNRRYKFILIGGWAVFLYTRSLKSKDIDLVVEYEELEKIRKEFILNKNNRLNKYEITIDEIDIDLYLPFYSNPGIPAEDIKKYTQNLEGFLVPRQEILLILKQKAYSERFGTPKAEKDKVDIVSLFGDTGFDFKFYKKILKKYHQERYLKELKGLLRTTIELPELGLNKFKYSRLKKKIISQL